MIIPDVPDGAHVRQERKKGLSCVAWGTLHVIQDHGHREAVTLCSQGTIDLVLIEMLFLSNQCLSASLRRFISGSFYSSVFCCSPKAKCQVVHNILSRREKMQ